MLWLLHWVHLQADFPNNSPWMDYSKYTDEGWYGKAAMSAILFGHWHNPGALNTAVALPVWPFLEWLVFLVTGVTVTAARGFALCVFLCNLVLSYAVLRAAGVRCLAAAFGVVLLAGSMYLWAFSRLAILEPLLTFWMLFAWLVALRLAPLEAGRLPDGPQLRRLLAIGVLCCLAVLTKTTAIFLLPSIGLLVCAAAQWRLRGVISSWAVTAIGGAIPWLIWYLLFTRRYPEDFHYFFQANYWQPPQGWLGYVLAYWWAVHGLLWVGPWLVCTVLAMLLVAAVLSRSLYRQPLVQASLLAAAGFVFFMGWHDSPQPRYCMVLAYPIVFVAITAVNTWRSRLPWLAFVASLALLVVLVRNAYASAWFAMHPEYTMRDAAEGITTYIRAHREQSPRLLSISADEITLFTHLPGLCDDFGTLPLPERIERYRPGWYAAWNELDPGTVDDIHAAGYWLQAVAHWRAFDDDDRDDLVLYRMVPIGGAQAAAPTRESAAP